MKKNNSWKALLQGAILLVMLILAGTVVFASECGDDGITTISSYGPAHATILWLDNNNEGNTRPEHVYVRDGHVQYVHPTISEETVKEWNEELRNRTYTRGYKVTSKGKWELGLFDIRAPYLAELYAPKGYDQIMKDGTTWEWQLCKYVGSAEYNRMNAGYEKSIHYIGYDGVQQYYFVNRLEGSEEELTKYKVTYKDNVEDAELFPDNVHDGIPANGVTPLFTGNKVREISGEDGIHYNQIVTTTDYGEPVRQGYTFLGWKDEAGNAFSPTVTKNTTYYAQWKEGTSQPSNRTYRVTYNDGVEDEVIFEDEVNRGNLYGAETPAFRGDTGRKDSDSNGNTIPVRFGYKFTGWKDEAGNDWSPTIVNCVTYYAQWEELPHVSTYYSVTYTDGVDGEEIFRDEVTFGISYGDKTPLFKNGDANGNPVREGYEFAGWTPEVADTVTGDVVYTAIWKKIETVTPEDPAVPEGSGTDVDDPDVPAGSLNGNDEAQAEDSDVPLGAADGAETGTPKTGDETPVALLIVLLALSACGFGALTLNRRKHQ
ncbi:MAG: InlB B-repeat-containing protein [Anaerovoracaceae bacterium]|nr:InlB B-repeat-containing protein [Anaerovoracaceae bacterium]